MILNQAPIWVLTKKCYLRHVTWSQRYLHSNLLWQLRFKLEIIEPLSGCDMITGKNCDLANEENRSNEKDRAQQIGGASAEKNSQEKISASETFWQEAFEMERKKNSCGETSEQGQRSSDEALLPAGN